MYYLIGVIIVPIRRLDILSTCRQDVCMCVYSTCIPVIDMFFISIISKSRTEIARNGCDMTVYTVSAYNSNGVKVKLVMIG